AVEAIVAGDPLPWETALQPAVPALQFLDAAFEVSDSPADGMQLRAAELNRWLKPVSNGSYQVREQVTGSTVWSQFEGVARLAAPWPQDAALQLAVFDGPQFQIHLWSGEQGVTLRWTASADRQQLAALLTRRQPGSPLPSRQTLAATDSGILQRSGNGPVSLQYHEGSLVVTRGSVRLLTVPLAAPPEEVYFEGRASLSELWMVRREPAPDRLPPERSLVISSVAPAQLEWVVGTDSPARLITAPPGSVELEYDASEPQPEKAVLWSGTPLPRSGLYEVIARIAQPEPGTGLYLGDAQGQPVHHIAFLRDKTTGWTTFDFGWSRYGYDSPGNVRDETEIRADAPAPTWAGETCWLRIVLGPGGLKLWVSGDGVHWSHALSEPVRQARGPYSSVGLFVLGGKESRRIRLDRLEVRQLDAVTTLASQELRARLVPLRSADEATWADWTAHMLETCPAEVSLPEWRRTVAVDSLEQFPPPELAARLLNELLEDGLNLPFHQHSADQKQQLLNEAAELADLYEPTQLVRLAGSFVHLAELRLERGEADAGGSIAAELIAAPIWSSIRMPAIPPELLRKSLLALLERRDWSLVRTTAWRFGFWLTPSHPDPRHRASVRQLEQWLDWADAVAASRLPRDRADTTAAAVIPREWRHPLVMAISREGYNVMAELEAALAGGAWQDACQIISGAPEAAAGRGTVGLLPDARDGELLVSLRNRIGLAMEDHPELAAGMKDSFGQSGLLRVREAINRADEDAVQNATLRYYGTTAAAEAHQFLGDRSLASGRFAQAIEHFRRALETSPDSLEPELQNRLVLATSLVAGENYVADSDQSRPGDHVDFGAVSISGTDFSRLISEIRQRVQGQEGTARKPGQPAAGTDAVFQPGTSLEVSASSPVTVSRPVQNPGSDSLDHVARQVSLITGSRLACVCDGIQLHVYDRKNGTLRYSVSPEGTPAGAGEWPDVACQPVLSPDSIFWRRLTSNRPQLVCVEKESGKTVWQTDLSVMLVSDPLLVRNRLVALTAQPIQDEQLELELTTFDQSTGEVVGRQPVLKLRDQWSGRPPVVVAASRGRIVLAVSGTLACVDLYGTPQWIRTLPRVPAAIDPNRAEQPPSPPLFAGGRVLVSPQGTRSIACVELESGRLIWSRSVPELHQPVGMAAGNVVLRTRSGVEARSLENGRLVWQHAAEQLLEGMLCHGSSVLLTRHLPAEGKEAVSQLVWLDARTGQPRFATAPGSAPQPQPALSNLHIDGGQLLALAGDRTSATERTLLTLTASDAAAVPIDAVLSSAGGWMDEPARHVQERLTSLGPGWLLLSKTGPAGTPQPDATGNAGPVLLESAPGQRLILARRIPETLSPQAQLKLTAALPAGSANDAGAVLTIRSGGQVLTTLEIEAGATPATGTMTLGPEVAGRWLVLTGKPAKAGAATAILVQQLETTTD
ncbi:MAG: PQQ-binding-like beta-propeller repeat protein, partial [Planctomycetaceae bacterium]|nr:PQQ-binding-like beta-propeller repeat protein [Planctomycetaceae bacterium]